MKWHMVVIVTSIIYLTVMNIGHKRTIRELKEVIVQLETECKQ